MTPVEFSDDDVLILHPAELSTIGGAQGYIPLPVARIYTREEVPVVSRWTFTDEERAQIAAGGDVYVTVFTWGRRFPPIAVTRGVPVFEGAQTKPIA